MFDHDAFDCVLRERFADDFEVAYAYDRYGRLAETAAFGSNVKYVYDAKGHLTSQTVNGELIEYVYTRRGQLAGKYLGGKLKPDAAVEYEYSPAGQIVARTANGVRQTYEYDFKGQLLGVKEGEEYVERYAYDRAGNMVKKVIRGSRFVVRDGVEILVRDGEDKVTTFTFDDANQLVSSTTDGITTRYEYDAAGRMIKEGDKTYTYGYLDKVTSVRDGANTYTYTYHPDGQLATADYGRARTPAAPQGEEDSPSFETFTWDGLALIQRGNEHFINESHIGGGNPVVSSKGTSYFNDMLGTTVGAKSGKTYSAATLTAFGEDFTHHCPPPLTFSTSSSFFTGKPAVVGLGHAFLMRNYRASLGKWQTADPMGYPDGWNQLAYCGNGVTGCVDLWGCSKAEDDALNDLLNTYKKLGANGNKQSLLDENDLTERNAQEIKNICSDAKIIYEDVGYVDLVEIKGSPYPHGVSYWSGDHKYQDWWQDAHKTQYRCSAYYALIPENALEVLMTQIIGGSATVIGSASYFWAALGTGAIGAGVAVGGLGAFIGSLFADKYVKVYLGLEFKKYYECEITLVEKRLIE